MGVDNGSDPSIPDSVLAVPVAQVFTTCPNQVFAGASLLEGDFTAHDGGS